MRTLVMWLGLTAASVAQGQIRLNALPLPGPLSSTATQGLQSLNTQLSPGLDQVRHLQIVSLYRAHPDVIDRDPSGEPVVRSRVLALNPTSTALNQARAMRFELLREEDIDGIDLHVAVLQAPPGLSTRKALEQLRRADPTGAYDYDHIYSTAGEVGAPDGLAPMPAAADARGPRSDTRIGLIDAGVEAGHPSLREAQIRPWGCQGRSVPTAHGTAIASLLIGQDNSFIGIAPGSVLFAADVYCGEPTGGSLDALIDALSWLVQQRVSVINVSLVGARNQLLEQAIERLIARGFVVVAAVGNDGPAAPPLYPASYPGVVGVTGVDAHNRVLIEAGKGVQVMFAAPGADLAAATPDGKYASVRGTSFASPIVTGLLALSMTQPDPQQAAAALRKLETSALHLGPAGRNLTYGFGLVGAQYRVDLAALNGSH